MYSKENTREKKGRKERKRGRKDEEKKTCRSLTVTQFIRVDLNKLLLKYLLFLSRLLS